MPKKKTPSKKITTKPKNVCPVPIGYEDKHAPKLSDLSWRIFRIMSEFVSGFEFLSKTENEVSIFGSARLPSTSKWYKESKKLGGMLASEGFAVITGGGPAIMEAANKGATEAGGESIGINIELPFEQRINKYVKRGMGFHYFFTRKVMLSASAQAYVFFPGGFGTLDEMFEMVELIQTKKSQKVPVVLIGKKFWSPLLEWINTTLKNEYKTISPKDAKLLILVDTAEEAMRHIRKSKERTIF